MGNVLYLSVPKFITPTVVLDTNKWYHKTEVLPGEVSVTIGAEYDWSLDAIILTYLETMVAPGGNSTTSSRISKSL